MNRSQGDEEPREPTSTLVLTSRKNLFVDLRIVTNPPASPLLDWGFAGRSRRDERGGSWDHWVDSNTDTPESDAGTLETLPNGDTLEKGTSVNNDGVLQTYEEVWRDVLVEPDVAIVFVCLGEILTSSTLAVDAEGEAYLDPKNVCGMVIRVGAWCQGLLKAEGEVTAERWALTEGQWQQTFRIGGGMLPCPEVCAPLDSSLNSSESAEGTLITHGGFQWYCVERYVGKS